ncbi:MAG TPA: hypothetical protein VMV98_03845 [Acidobacteriaceae bacterium]|nr:hypothetical protein [Acidobacteriaceae bacterium]
MSRFHSTVRDDDNDTRLFDTLEHYILEHYPNPERIGCLDQDLLRRFVETPELLDLSDPKYLHVFKCAECTRELGDLRRIREARIQQDVVSSPFSSAGMKAIEKWRRHIVTAAFKTRMLVRRFVERLKSVFR